MFLSKLKIAGSLIATGALIAGTGAIARQQGGAHSTAADASAVTTTDNGRPATTSQSSSSSFKEVDANVFRSRAAARSETGSDADATGQTLKLHDAYLDRIKAAKDLYDASIRFYQEGQVTGPGLVIESSEKWMQAERDFAASTQDRSHSVKAHIERMTSLAEREKAKLDAGMGSLPEYREASYAVADAKLALLRLEEVGEPNLPPAQPRKRLAKPRPDNPTSAMMGSMAGMQAMAAMMGSMAGMPGMPVQGRGPGRVANDRALEREDEEDEIRNELIRQVLLKPMPMPFGQPTPLKDLFTYIKQATITPTLPNGLPIYIDPKTLDKLQNPEVVIDMDGVRLKTTLRLALRQLDLGYYIRDGLLMIELRTTPEFLKASREELNTPTPAEPKQEPQFAPLGVPGDPLEKTDAYQPSPG